MRLAVLVASCFCFAGALAAGPITFQFTGTITQVPIDEVFGDISPDQLISGSYTFESTSLDGDPGDPAIGSYASPTEIPMASTWRPALIRFRRTSYSTSEYSMRLSISTPFLLRTAALRKRSPFFFKTRAARCSAATVFRSRHRHSIRLPPRWSPFKWMWLWTPAKFR